MTVFLRLAGKLDNQLFQLSAAYWFAQKHNRCLIIDSKALHNYYPPRSLSLNNLLGQQFINSYKPASIQLNYISKRVSALGWVNSCHFFDLITLIF